MGVIQIRAKRGSPPVQEAEDEGRPYDQGDTATHGQQDEGQDHTGHPGEGQAQFLLGSVQCRGSRSRWAAKLSAVWVFAQSR